jgi:hypothetical protein
MSATPEHHQGAELEQAGKQAVAVQYWSLERNYKSRTL